MKKIIALLLVVALTASASIAGTLAYLQDEDEQVNVMTLGSVYIEQIEKERDADGNLVDFYQGKPAFPAVGPIEWAEEGVEVNGTKYKVFTEKLKNVVDKIVTVENTGKSDAYIRTLVAIEAPDGDPNDLIHINWNGTDTVISDPVQIKVDDVDYVVFAFTYKEALSAGAKSAPSLMQVFLDSKATNEDCAKFGDTWEIRVLSQAIQIAGFEPSVMTTSESAPSAAENALNTGFGVVTVEYATDLFSGEAFKNYIVASDAQSLKDAMLVRGAKIVLSDNIVVDNDTPLQWGKYMFVANGREVTIDLNGKNIIVEEDSLLKANALFTTANKGTLNIVGNGVVEIKNGKSGVFHAMNGDDQINVYGGTYISNSDNGSDALAIIYTNSGNVDVYGGKFCSLDGIQHANAEDRQGNRLSVVFHEGALMNHEIYQKGDSSRVQLAEGCEIKEVVIASETWYQVVK